jgi:hypothetical protein
MREILYELQSKIGSARMKWQKRVAAIGLIPYGVSRWKQNRSGIAKASDASQSSKVMIEGTILLHQDDDVFNVGDGAVAVIGRNLQRPTDACRESGAAGGQKLEEGTAVSTHGTKA